MCGTIKNEYESCLSICFLCFVPAVSGGGPSSVSVSEETAVSLVVSWVPPNAHVLQYRVSYTALTGAESQDSTVSERWSSPLPFVVHAVRQEMLLIGHRKFQKLLNDSKNCLMIVSLVIWLWHCVFVIFRCWSQGMKSRFCSSHYSQIHVMASWWPPSITTGKEAALQLRAKPVSQTHNFDTHSCWNS